MNYLDDEPKHSERTMTQMIVGVSGLMFLSFLALLSTDDEVSTSSIITALFFIVWIGALIWIGNYKK